MKKIVLLLILVLILTGCSTVKTQGASSQELNSQKQSLEPKQVVENYFKYYNEENLEGVNSALTQWSH